MIELEEVKKQRRQTLQLKLPPMIRQKSEFRRKLSKFIASTINNGTKSDPKKCIRCLQMKICMVHPQNIENVRRFKQAVEAGWNHTEKIEVHCVHPIQKCEEHHTYHCI